MKIYILDDGKRMNFRFPLSLIANRFILKLINKKYRDDLLLSVQQLKEIKKIVKATKRKNKNWCLVEVEENGVETLRINP